MSKQKGELTPLQRVERLVLLSLSPQPPNRSTEAIWQLVNAVRAYRALVTKALSQRLGLEGDAVALYDLEHGQAEIEQLNQ